MPERLDLGKVMVGAFLVPWWHRRAFARALAVPLLLLVAYSVFWYYFAVPALPAWTLWLVHGMYGLLFTLFAVKCHRLVLLDPESVGRQWQPRWTWRETRFFFWILSLWLAGLGAMLVILTVIVNAWGFVAKLDGDGIEWVTFAVKLVPLYVFARLCVLLPATAVDHQPTPTLRWAWQLTEDNGWRLLIVVAAMPWLLSLLVGFLYRTDATTAEWLLLTVFAVALFAVEVAAISISYRDLTKHNAVSGSGP